MKENWNLEYAQIMGQPLDPRKPFPIGVEAVCETRTAVINDYHYVYDVLLETDKIITMNNGAALTQENVSPDEPALLTFQDVGTPDYWIKVQELASAKEDTLKRKNMTINRALNARELQYLVTLLSTAAEAVNHNRNLQSGRTRFSFDDLVFMLEDVTDYGDNFKFIAGTQVNQDMTLWNWNDNKYTDLIQAFKNLNIEKTRVSGSVTIDGSATAILPTTDAYLVATDTEVGKPGLFVRKKLNDIEFLGGSILKNGDKPERLVFIGHNPKTVTISGTTYSYLAVSCTGYEQVVAAIINPYAVSRFSRS